MELGTFGTLEVEPSPRHARDEASPPAHLLASGPLLATCGGRRQMRRRLRRHRRSFPSRASEQRPIRRRRSSSTRASSRRARESFAGLGDAVWTGDSWLLFTKVAAPPPSEMLSGIWHIGWGAEDMQSTYQKQLARGTSFATPLTDISDMVGGNRPFFYAYVDGPDHALIELNTAQPSQLRARAHVQRRSAGRGRVVREALRRAQFSANGSSASTVTCRSRRQRS